MLSLRCHQASLLASDLGSDGSVLEPNENWELVVSCDRGHPCSTPSHPSLATETSRVYPAKQEETRRKSLCVFLVAAGQVLH